MRMIPADSATQLHRLGPKGAPRSAVPENRQRVPALVSTTVALNHGPGHPETAGEAVIPSPVARSEQKTPKPAPEGASKAERKPAPKRAPVAAHRPNVAKEQPGTGKKATRDKPAPQAKPEAMAREGSKKETVLALLRRPHGATLAEIMKATGWQSHSVHGFLSGALRKKMALKIKSGKRDNGERLYSIRA